MQRPDGGKTEHSRLPCESLWEAFASSGEALNPSANLQTICCVSRGEGSGGLELRKDAAGALQNFLGHCEANRRLVAVSPHLRRDGDRAYMQLIDGCGDAVLQVATPDLCPV